MRPLPTHPENPAPGPARRVAATGPATLELGPTHASNQRRGSCPTQRAYPWLLGLSTLLAGAFCFLYITKPVIRPAGPPPGTPALAAAPAESDPSPPADPPAEESATRPAVVAPETLSDPDHDPFEETHLRIQHILGATGPDGGDLGRITLDVPILYRSGTIRWTGEDVARARSLLTRIRDHQQRSRDLRDEAVGLISEWDDLVIRSIPETALRADSPTLPENQGAGTAAHAPLKSTEAIEIEKR